MSKPMLGSGPSLRRAEAELLIELAAGLAAYVGAPATHMGIPLAKAPTIPSATIEADDAMPDPDQ
jgi:hypothetical protein